MPPPAARPILRLAMEAVAVAIAIYLMRIRQGWLRLLVRDRARWKLAEWPFAVLVYEPLHGYMETGPIDGVKRRAEATNDGDGAIRPARPRMVVLGYGLQP
jgi:hypothetical protein